MEFIFLVVFILMMPNIVKQEELSSKRKIERMYQERLLNETNTSTN